jgi:hypothetical protein
MDYDDCPRNIHPKVAPSDFSWFERICFSLVALLIQCEFTYPPAATEKKIPLTTSILDAGFEKHPLGDATTVVFILLAHRSPLRSNGH